MDEEETPDWLKPTIPSDLKIEEPLQEDQPDWLMSTTVASVPPPPTPVVPEDEPDDSYWGRFTKWSQPIVNPTVMPVLITTEIPTALNLNSFDNLA